MIRFFDEMSETTCRLTALALAIMAGMIFSVYVEPVWGEWLPRWLYWIPRSISGEHTVVHQAGMVGIIMSMLLVVFLYLRGFLCIQKKSIYTCIMLFVDIYVLGLLFDIVFGDTSKFLQGGVTSMAAVGVYAVCVFGMKEYVSVAMVLLGCLCLVNIITAESVVFLGSVGIILIFISLFLQCDNFFEKLGSITLDLKGK